LRKIIKNGGHFPNDEAVVKLLWLAIATSRTNAPDNGPRKPARRGTSARRRPKLVEGGQVQGWNAAMSVATYGALSLAFPGRLDPRI
jgi:putative transposase